MNTDKHIKRILNNKHLISFGDSDDDNECIHNVRQLPSTNNNEHELKEHSNETHNNKNGNDGDDDDDSVSLSENDEVVRNAKASSGIICNEKKHNELPLNINSNNKSNDIHERNTEIALLTNEINNIKNNINTTSQSFFKEQQNKNSMLEHYNKKYLHLKRNRNNTNNNNNKVSSYKSLPSKIAIFHDHLLNAQSNPSKHSWLTSKLKFHVDSEKAYSLSKLNQN